MKILIFLAVFLLISCNGNNFSEKIKVEEKSDLQIIAYENIDLLDFECKKIASEYYTLHDVKISQFFKITQKMGCDFNGDKFTDSIYELTPINQTFDKPDCFETEEIDTTIILIFKNFSKEQKIFRVYKNLFCPLSPTLIYRELVFNNDFFILKKDFGFGNGRKIYSDLYFSWKDDFYADSILIHTYEKGVESINKKIFVNTKLSELKGYDCDNY